jgi:hypothetical protein
MASFDARAQEPARPAPAEADFRLVVLGHFDTETLAEFRKRLQRYVALREIVERGAPPLRITDNADEITTAEEKLTERLREARAGSERGEIFIPRIAAQIKKLLVLQLDAMTLNAIMEDGPGEFDVDVNEAYPKERPLAMMPPNVLLQLPELPRDMEYRFVGRHLVLRDVRANMIVDEIPHAIECKDCVPPPEEIAEPPHQ